MPVVGGLGRAVRPGDRAELAGDPWPGVAGPLTGGQNVAHEPLQLDLAGVSGANQ